MDCQLAQPGFWLDAAQALFVLFGVIIAGLGLSTWRHELIGRRKIEVAEEALGAFLKVWNAIDAARSPHGHAGEGASRPGRDKEPDGPARDQKDVFYVPIERLQRHKETFKELEMITPKAIIYFGDGVLGPIKEINDVLINLDRSATNLLETFDNRSNNLNRDREKWRRTIIHTGKGDEISAQLAKALSRMEEILRPYVQFPSDRWRRWQTRHWTDH
jgi:hypothetical protein